jgi:glycosyltransferase involved in cell wall biosynthesis
MHEHVSPPIVAIDARDAAASELRGWGRYELELVRALRAGACEGFQLRVLERGGPGPELLFEQVKLPWMLRRTRAAAVHATNCFLPLLRPCPGVVTIQDLAFEAWPADFGAITGRKYRTIAPLAARSAERIICPSDFTRDDLCARYGVDAAKVRVIPLAPALPLAQDANGAHAPAEEHPEPYLLAIGDLRAKKNLGVLVAAFRRLRSREPRVPHRLVLAGVDAGEGDRLRRLAGGEPIQLTGYVTDSRLDQLIRGADLVVHPSRYEGFGLVVLEAMARGTPVAAARGTALPQTGGEAAAYFDPEDADDIAAVVGSLLRDPEAREALSQRGIERAAEFTWERTARETAAVYRELL